VGIAYIETVCSDSSEQNFKVAIVEYFSDDLSTGQVI